MNAVVLAGGRSTRMGRDKASLPFGGVPLLRRVVERLRPVVDEVIVVANDGAPAAGPGARVVADAFPGLGPLAGLHAGLRASGAERNLVVACDLPFASPALAVHLRDRAAGADAAIPLFRGRPEPLHGVYRRGCLAVAEAQLRRGELALARFLERLRVVWVEEAEVARFGVPERIFLNVNRPGELEQALALAAAEAADPGPS